MVSIATITMLGLTALLMFASVLFGLIKYRKEPNFIMNVLIGFVIYFFAQSTLGIVLSFIGNNINAMMYDTLIGLNFVLVSFITLLILKKISKISIFNHRAITIGSSFFVTLKLTIAFIYYFISSLALNQNDLTGAFPMKTETDILKLTQELIGLNFFVILYNLLFVVVTVLSYAYCLKRLIEYVNGKKDSKTILEVIALMIVVNAIPEFIATFVINSPLLISIVFVLISVFIVFLDKKRA